MRSAALDRRSRPVHLPTTGQPGSFLLVVAACFPIEDGDELGQGFYSSWITRVSTEDVQFDRETGDLAVERRGFEPLTSAVRGQRSPS